MATKDEYEVARLHSAPSAAAAREAAVGAGDGVEDSGKFSFYITVSTIAGFCRDGDHGIFQNRFSVRFFAVIFCQSSQEVGDFSQFHMSVCSQSFVLFLFVELVPPFVAATCVA